MNSFVYMLLCAITGGVLAATDVSISNWQFWVILGCVCGARISGYISGMKSNT
jgi:hypothetical protein